MAMHDIREREAALGALGLALSSRRPEADIRVTRDPQRRLGRHGERTVSKKMPCALGRTVSRGEQNVGNRDFFDGLACWREVFQSVLRRTDRPSRRDLCPDLLAPLLSGKAQRLTGQIS